MRAKRSKQYKKLMQQFQLHHGFREPYQVLVDADLVRDAQRFTMDLQAGLERTLHGKVKIMITQCCIRHLYTRAREEPGPAGRAAIELAKTFERRRCGHKPEDYEEPLSTLSCLGHVVDGKGRNQNKNCYVVASQDAEVRRHMRGIAGVPLIYISRSVMIMEPMSTSTVQIGARAERAKFRSELRPTAGEKRKREGDGSEEEDDDDADDDTDKEDDADDAKDTADAVDAGPKPPKKKKQYGRKEPNPLSVKKKSKAQPARPTETAAKKKRKRKHKAKTEGEDEE